MQETPADAVKPGRFSHLSVARYALFPLKYASSAATTLHASTSTGTAGSASQWSPGGVSPGQTPVSHFAVRQNGNPSVSSVQSMNIARAGSKLFGDGHDIAPPPQLKSAVGKPVAHDDVHVNPGD